MNNRSLLVMGLAVAIGLGAMLLTRQIMTPDRNNKVEETQDVLVATRDIKEEETLKPDMAKVIKMARSAVPPYTFSAFKDVEERWVKTALLEGDVIVEKKLGPKGTPPGLVANIPAGMRAFALDVTEQTGVSGFILPGHHVNVLRFESTERNEFHAETILQDKLVLAAGQVFSRPDERTVQSRTVTLALKPEEVAVVVAARGKGSLSLALRGVNDHDVLAPVKHAPPNNPEQEKRLKAEEEKRKSLEQELSQLKQELAKKNLPPPVKKAIASPRIATIYRGIKDIERIRLDIPGVIELSAADEKD